MYLYFPVSTLRHLIVSHTNTCTSTWEYDLTRYRYVLCPFQRVTFCMTVPVWPCSQSGVRIRIHFIRIRIQHFRMDTNPDPDPDPDPIRIQGFKDQKLKKNCSWKKNKKFFWSKTVIYLSLGLHKVPMSKLQKKPSALKRGHPTLQNMNFYKFSYFCGSPESGSGSTDPIESGSNPDPDPQPCSQYINICLVFTVHQQAWQIRVQLLFCVPLASWYRYRIYIDAKLATQLNSILIVLCVPVVFWFSEKSVRTGIGTGTWYITITGTVFCINFSVKVVNTLPVPVLTVLHFLWDIKVKWEVCEYVCPIPTDP